MADVENCLVPASAFVGIVGFVVAGTGLALCPRWCRQSETVRTLSPDCQLSPSAFAQRLLDVVV